jgi:hypothetical protein
MASAIGLLLSIYSCNNQDSSSNTTNKTAEIKNADTASTGGKTDTITVKPETPKVKEIKIML